MWEDPIVEEIHRYREAHAKKFNYDMWAIYEDIKAKEKQSELEGWRLVSRCPVKTPDTELESSSGEGDREGDEGVNGFGYSSTNLTGLEDLSGLKAAPG